MIVNVIFGGAGFIGLNLSNALIERGEQVISYDNYYTGSKEYCSWIKAHHKDAYEYNTADITDEKMMNTILKKLKKLQSHNEIHIYNLACPASPVHYQAEPLKTFLASTQGVENVCKMSVALKCPMVYTSTSEVYGDPQVHPQPEDYWGNVHTMGPRSCYDEGKRAGETIVYIYRKQNPKLKVARLFNTYGRYMNPEDGRFISNFICALLRGEKMKIHGVGGQTRSICFVDDTVRGLIALMNSDFNGPVNLGKDIERTVLDWAHIIYQIMVDDGTEKRSFDQCIAFVLADVDDPKQRKPDLTVAAQELNWRPEYSDIEGLTLTKDYFKTIL